MSGGQSSDYRYFNENSPRPPVPGEERGSRRQPSPERQRRTFTAASCDAGAFLGFEMEGRCKMDDTEAPALHCLQWSRSLHNLLEDPQGLELFEQYLQQEGHLCALSFWFACEGLKEEQDPNKFVTITKVLFRRFLQRPQLALPDNVRKEMRRTLREGQTDKRFFYLAQKEVERLIADSAYPKFLQSDIYLHHVRRCQGKSEEHSPDYENLFMENANKPLLLPTLHEDRELPSNSQHQVEHKKEMRLTKDVLVATQNYRVLESKRKPEAYAGTYLQPGASPYHATVSRPGHYSSYNPVSRQDSELQSLSSDARTESDNLSLTDASVDGVSIGKRANRKQYIRQHKAMKESALINRDAVGHESIIPRTQRISREQTQPIRPDAFARQLIEKLEKVKREQDNQERLERKLKEVGASEENLYVQNQAVTMSAAPCSLAAALKEKLQVEEDSDQSILDQHVSRVWSDLTPSRSPKLSSPRSRSPDKRRTSLQQASIHQRYKQKKEKDMFSTFSGDSGNVHDYSEIGDVMAAGSVSSLNSHIPKSKSVPSDCGECFQNDQYLQGVQDPRYKRLETRSATKKSMTELTDSGVSVISDVPLKDARLINWLNEAEYKKADASKYSRYMKKYASQSVNLERAKQPFVADPGMPPLPQPHTPTQLEEAKRRLILQEEERTRNSRHLNSKLSYDSPFNRNSSQSTLRRTKQDVSDFTIVVFSFCDEQVPYRTKIPGQNITLRQFKEFLPKKGSYRYFFKTECEDVDTKVIQEEITDDMEILPLWEGKVMAQVKALD